MTSSISLLALAIALAAPTSPPASTSASTGKTGVFLLSPTNADAAVAQAVLDGMAGELTQTGALEVLTPSDVARLTDFAADRAKAGCDDKNAACLAELGNALGVPLLVSTSIVKIEGAYVASMTLLSVDQVKTVGRETAAPKDGTAAALIEEARRAVLRLLGPFLSQASGTLVVDASEEGADVRVDGRLLGTTPLEGARVAAGKHEIAVSKAGFIEARRDVVMAPQGKLDVDATLAPSEETARSWALGAWAMRGSGIGACVLGALGVAGGATLFAFNAARADELKRTNGGRISSAEAQVFLVRDVAGFSLLGGAALAFGSGALLLFLGGDPGRYDGLVGTPSAIDVVE